MADMFGGYSSNDPGASDSSNPLTGGFSGESGGAPFTGYSPPGGGFDNVPRDGGSSFWDQLSQQLQDPETLKAFANLAKAQAGLTQAGQNLPPHSQQLLKRGLSEFQQQKQRQAGKRPYEPFLGDMEAFRMQIPPPVALQALRNLGITGDFR